ncbi:MAG: hypothetical protein FWE40_05545 [Oscillospiraceae bacterium]|jgi:hypothetical protein|nr:hypothetical protein [Oscillospiraceae bacterium]
MQEENSGKRKTHTSTAVKNRYNQKTYANFQFKVRYDDELNDQLKAYEGSLSELIRNLLRDHFAKQK